MSKIMQYLSVSSAFQALGVHKLNSDFTSRIKEAISTKVERVVKVIKDSFGRRKIQRKLTPYKGRKSHQSQTNRQRFWAKVRSTHSNVPDPRKRHFWHAAARNREKGIVTL